MEIGISKTNINRNSKKLSARQIFTTIIFFVMLIIMMHTRNNVINTKNENTVSINSETINFSLENIPEYTNKLYVEINNNKPYFEESDYTTEAFEKYSKLDSKGRCGVCYANICKEIMPKNGEVRQSISSVKPTGWEQTKVDGEYIYNRCHLIGYQLAGENANELNLITGTKYFNVSGMLPFENTVASYIDENQSNHVLYRVTPIFIGENLLASGVEIEASSVEDKGEKLGFNVYIYNVQPGVKIDYSTGKVIGS